MRPGATKLETCVPDITRLDTVAKVDSGNAGSFAFEHRMQDSDVMVGMTEVGQ